MKTIRCLLFALTLALPVALRAAQPEPPPPVENQWTAIKDITYEKRADFSAGTARLVEKLDAEIQQLNEKRATLPETSVKDWDFAMKEVKDSYAYLKASIAELSKVTLETWAEAKEKIGKAWQRAEDACDKVRTSTTS